MMSFIFTSFSGYLQGRRQKILQLVQIQCRQCGVHFCICRKCWKGQRYCGADCKELGYEKRRRKANRQYRKTDKGKKKHNEAEERRRCRLQLDKKKKNGGTKKKKKQLPAKQNNRYSAPAPVKNTKITNTFKHSKKKHGKKKSTKGSKGACHLCGAEGVIVKRISWNCGKAHPYFSFRIKRRETRETSDTNIGKDKKFISKGIRLYWQKE